MTQDPYASCPCGSGKKFKWCCQPIYSAIEHAYQQEANGQHDTAVRLMEQVTQEHRDNPEAWGQKARLHAAQGNLDAAEEALEKAFALNPSYPFGLMLRAQLRREEGEFQGALLLARRAAEAYAPEAKDALAEIQSIIFDCEMRLNRPVAARAALTRLEFLAPEDENVQGAVERVFGPQSRFPLAATRVYTLRQPAGGTQGARRQAWNRALGDREAKLSDLVRAFEVVTKEDPRDAAGWFNLGLSRAWLGDNAGALTALDHAVELEADETAAIEAAELMEVLRLGHGMGEQSDYHEYSFVHQITRFEPIQALIQEWATQKRLIPLPTDQEGVFVGMVLELSTSGLITAGRPAQEVGKVAGYIAIIGPILRFTTSVHDRYGRIKDEVRQKLSLGLTDLTEHQGPAQFQEMLTEALSYPLTPRDEQAQIQEVIDYVARFFEETWIHRPLKSLSNIAPVDAVGHAKLRRRLLGVIAFLEQVATKGIMAKYDFNHLRRKLGLQPGSTASTPTTPAAAGPALDIASMGAAELAALAVPDLSDDHLEKAYQTAYRLDAHEIAEHFARALVARPVGSGKPDRYPWFSFLIQKGLRDGNLDAAMKDVAEGERQDAESNTGKRQTDYALFRAQVHGRQGDVEGAYNVFQGLIAKTPRDFKVRGQAAETLLKLKDAARALTIAEAGVKAAREANDRDSENYLMELAAAAKRKLS
ncbi:MAG: tetratricopeptide repeat protein [Gemmataceae bacterium]